VQQHPVLEGIETDDKVGLQRLALDELPVKAFHLVIKLVDNLGLAPPKDLQTIRDAARYPTLKQVTASGQLGSLYHTSVLAGSCASEEYEASAFGHGCDDLAGSAQVSGGDFQRDDVDAVSYTEDVARVGRIPERCGVSKMRLRREKEFKRDVGQSGRIGNERVRPVTRPNSRAKVSQELLCTLPSVGCLWNEVRAASAYFAA
jgi:hypothetical protein